MTVSLELLARGPARPDLLEDLVVDETTIAETLGRWSVSAPVVVDVDRVTGQPALDEVAAVLAGGAPAVVVVAPGLAALTPAGGDATRPADTSHTPGTPVPTEAGAPTPTGVGGTGPAPAQSAAHLADLLAVATHAGVGFGSGLIPRCEDASQVWAILAGAVAALTGGDIKAAVAAPDPAAIVGLSRSAREAIRDVVTCVIVPRGRAADIATELMTRTAADAG